MDSRLPNWSAAIALLFIALLPSAAVAQEDEEDVSVLDPELRAFLASSLHIGGGFEFSWTQTKTDEQEDDLITFGLEGDVGYFLTDGLKISGLPLFSVSHQDDTTSLLVGAAVGAGYYLDLGPLAPFARARGGMLFGSMKSETNSNLRGFLYGVGLGAAVPVQSDVIELAAEYVYTSLTADGGQGSQDRAQNQVLIRLTYLMVL